MKRNSFILILIFVYLLTSCKKDEDKTDRYSFWKGDIVNRYYLLDMNNQKLHVVEGKPFMIVEYDPVNLIPVAVIFGLDEAKNVYLPGCEGAIPEPFISDLKYKERLNLKGPMALLCDYCQVTNATQYEFWIDKGENWLGHEILHFEFQVINGISTMTGEIINETAEWGGRVSDENAFILNWLFNSNTITTN